MRMGLIQYANLWGNPEKSVGDKMEVKLKIRCLIL